MCHADRDRRQAASVPALVGPSHDVRHAAPDHRAAGRDGREQALGETSSATPSGDLDAAIDAVDEFCYRQSVIDERRRRRRADPGRAIGEPSRGACSSSAPTAATARCAPSRHAEDAQLYSIEFNPDNARSPADPRATPASADRVTVVVGTLGDSGDDGLHARVRAPLRRRDRSTSSSLDHDERRRAGRTEDGSSARWLPRRAIAARDRQRRSQARRVQRSRQPSVEATTGTADAVTRRVTGRGNASMLRASAGSADAVASTSDRYRGPTLDPVVAASRPRSTSCSERARRT